MMEPGYQYWAEASLLMRTITHEAGFELRNQVGQAIGSIGFRWEDNQQLIRATPQQYREYCDAAVLP